jgi:hypothetical protein
MLDKGFHGMQLQLGGDTEVLQPLLRLLQTPSPPALKTPNLNEYEVAQMLACCGAARLLDSDQGEGNVAVCRAAGMVGALVRMVGNDVRAGRHSMATQPLAAILRQDGDRDSIQEAVEAGAIQHLMDETRMTPTQQMTPHGRTQQHAVLALASLAVRPDPAVSRALLQAGFVEQLVAYLRSADPRRLGDTPAGGGLRDARFAVASCAWLVQPGQPPECAQAMLRAGAAPLLLRTYWAATCCILVGRGLSELDISDIEEVLKRAPPALHVLGVGHEVLEAHRFIAGSAPDRVRCCACGAEQARGAEAAFPRCGGCKAVRYCSAACQRAHWRQHKALCTLGRRQ